MNGLLRTGTVENIRQPEAALEGGLWVEGLHYM